jgi:serine/threonine-protein kinase
MRDISPEWWAKAQPILDRALELPPDEVPAWLDEACGADHPLRARVEALLATERDSGDFLASLHGTIVNDALAGWAEGAPTGAPADVPPRIGPYRPSSELGRGGMGVVYRATRADGQFEQDVALKLVRSGLAAPEIERRFLHERQILARLDHPNIARLLDGGCTEDGKPWFAMTLVDGQPITEYCDGHALGIDRRLDLFLEAADAVRYAHRNLVVHRDLKPSNILVDTSGHVKLLDFGIAKLLDETLESDLTRAGLQLMTPDFAAPEQVRGGLVTTGTDVHALGLVLYELLSGHRARSFESHTPAEYVRVICDTEPVPPSTAAGRERAVRHADGRTTVLAPEPVARARGLAPEQLRRRLAGDLDRIVLKAIALEPNRRYASVEALVEDLLRARSGLPVLARPATARYRLGKFVRRHRAGVTAAVVAVLALAGGLTVALWQASAARREAARATAVRTFLGDLFASADPAESRGRDVTARELLDRGARALAGTSGTEPALRLDLLGEIGRLYAALGDYARADSLLGRAEELARVHHGPASAELGSVLHERGIIQRLAGRLAVSDSLLQRALAIRSRRLGAGDPAVAATLIELATTAFDLNDYVRADSLSRRALAIDLARFGPQDLRVARDLDRRGLILQNSEGWQASADSAFRAALAIQRRHHDRGHPELIRTLNDFAAALRTSRRYAEAESLHREILAEQQRLYPTGHPEIASTLTHLAIALSRQRRYAEAESLQSAALAMRERLLGDGHPLTILALNDLAVLEATQGDYAAAEPAFRDVIARSRAALGPTHSQTVSALNSLAVVLSRQSRYAAAESLYRDVLAVRRVESGPQGPGVARTLVDLGITLRNADRLNDAERCFREAIAICRLRPEDRRRQLALALDGLGSLFLDRRRFAEAVVPLREAARLHALEFDRGDVRRALAERHLGVALAGLGQRAEAESLFLAAFRALEGGSEGGRVRARTALDLADLYGGWKRPSDAARWRAEGERLASAAGLQSPGSGNRGTGR